MTDNDYLGGFSTLTRYGTLNVSATRVPRKKRSRGNVTQPRTRTIALTECVSIKVDADGNETRTLFSPSPRTRKPNRVTAMNEAADRQNKLDNNRNSKFHRSSAANLAPIGNID